MFSIPGPRLDPCRARWLAQDVQVDWGCLGQALQEAVNLFNVESHVGFTLPAAQHQVIHFLGTGAWSLEHAALGNALDNLQEETNKK